MTTKQDILDALATAVPHSATGRCSRSAARSSVPFGIGKWTPMADWYEPEEFRGHVREPDVDDLRYIARDLKLADVKVYGRNWVGYYSKYRFARVGTRLFDRALRLRPSLCSDIYVTGIKNAGGSCAR